jgi:hypothetical protein
VRSRGPSWLFVIYIIVGVLVAAGVIGDDNYLNGVSNIEEVLNAVLAVLLWPLVLLGINFNIGHGSGSGGGASAGHGSGGGGK